MFTGIVTETGTIRRAKLKGGMLHLEVECGAIARELKRGDSVAVNGVCLTATHAGRRRFLTEAMPETVARTTLAELKRGRSVNLELPARPLDRLGGHIVQGHIDGVVRVVRAEEEDGARRAWLAAPEDVVSYLVPKGSVALDGVSLTVVDVGRATFQVALIPQTLETTTLGELQVDSRLNAEVDILAKYVERAIDRRGGGRGPRREANEAPWRRGSPGERKNA